MLTFSHGGGGSWLGNLMWHLHHNDFSLPSNNKSIFDGNPDSTDYYSIQHPFKHINLETIVMNDHSNYRVIKYGSEYPFQLYLNEIKKIRCTIFNNAELSVTEQFDTFTNAAKAWMTDPLMQKFYCKDLDLDIKWLFVNPEEFIRQLFTILDTTDMPYSKNIDYCLRSIDNYKSTCYNPKEQIGNLESVVWLAWCHAIIMVNKIALSEPFNFMSATSLEQIAEAIEPVHNQCLELSKPWYFLWKENE